MAKIFLVTNILFSVFLLFILTSCYHEVEEKVSVPERLLSKDSLVAIITEVQLADGAVTYKRISHKNGINDKEKYYAFIYKKYQITPKLLKENIDYYNIDPEKMIAIYDEVLARLSQLEAKINLELKEQEKVKQDSLNFIDTTVFVRNTLEPYFDSTLSKPFIW